jgi:hypothetical protein
MGAMFFLSHSTVFIFSCVPFCLQRDWFMAHLIVNATSSSSSSDGGAANAIVSYKDWGVLGSAEDPDACIISRPARDKASRLARDMRIAAGLTDPLGFYEDGSPELARVARWVNCMGEVDCVAEGGVDRLHENRLQLICEAKMRCIKLRATPFHKAVVHAVNQSIAQVDRARDAQGEGAVRAQR